jgi:deazaflavin-dependent oxidoreductase (nitroreductase family)
VIDLFAELARNRTIDITTTGARSGEPRRIETWGWPLDDVLYLTGAPGRRNWYANLKAEPAFTLHVAGEDVAGRARPIEDPAERRDVFGRLLDGTGYDLERWIEESPLVEVAL